MLLLTQMLVVLSESLTAAGRNYLWYHSSRHFGCFSLVLKELFRDGVLQGLEQVVIIRDDSLAVIFPCLNFCTKNVEE